jgi:hypothetical protein
MPFEFAAPAGRVSYLPTTHPPTQKFYAFLAKKTLLRLYPPAQHVYYTAAPLLHFSRITIHPPLDYCDFVILHRQSYSILVYFCFPQFNLPSHLFVLFPLLAPKFCSPPSGHLSASPFFIILFVRYFTGPSPHRGGRPLICPSTREVLYGAEPQYARFSFVLLHFFQEQTLCYLMYPTFRYSYDKAIMHFLFSHLLSDSGNVLSSRPQLATNCRDVSRLATAA